MKKRSLHYVLGAVLSTSLIFGQANVQATTENVDVPKEVEMPIDVVVEEEVTEFEEQKEGSVVNETTDEQAEFSNEEPNVDEQQDDVINEDTSESNESSSPEDSENVSDENQEEISEEDASSGTTIKEEIQVSVPEDVEQEEMIIFKETIVGNNVNIGSLSAKKINDNEALAVINGSISLDSLESILESIKLEMESKLGTEVNVNPLTHTDVTEGEAIVITGMNIPFAYINRDTNTVQLKSNVDRVSIKITIK